MRNIQVSLFFRQKWPKMATICKTRIFLKKGFRVNLNTRYCSLTSSKISKKSNVPILRNIHVSLFFRQKWPKMATICKTRILLKKGFTVKLYPLIVSNFMQNIKKNLMCQYWVIYKKAIFRPKMTENGQNLKNENFP